ncbi:MAG: hypothetical protein QOI02_1893 [Actinomycetota bacterium]|nr:hypothetical protein [Actinomycetota bacterium]
MTQVVVGLDVGGTKTDVIVETLDGQRLLVADVPSTGWDAEPVESGAAWISDLLGRVVAPEHEIVSVGIGAQGLDTAEIAAQFRAALAATGIVATAVNDAALLIPAAGFAEGIGLISGTGAIGVSYDQYQRLLVTGGWGWVIGDEAGAAGIVRRATQVALLSHDDGAADDGLLSNLLAGFDVADAERLARVVNDDPTMANWGPRASAVFAAADTGSSLAISVIAEAADHLVRLVTQLVRRGAAGTHVVAAGGVIVNQPRLQDALRSRLAVRHPQLTLTLLDRPPVEGALALARALLASPLA